MAYGFYPFLGWSLFIIGFIVAIILFAKYKKLYSVFYLISICLYIFTAGFTIDVFEFKEFGILTTLVISAILFMLLGFYLSHIHSSDDR